MALAGDALTTRRELARTYKELSVDLIGLLGYYQLQTAGDEAAVRRALTLMELAAPYMPQTELTLGLAEAYHRLGRTSDARQLVRSVLAANPDQPAAKALLDKLGT